MVKGSTKLKTVQETKMHDHSCLFFASKKEFFHCAIPFIREGLKNNEKCYLIIDEITKEEVLRNFTSIFREGYMPPDEFSGTKGIVIKHFKEIYLTHGAFDSERTIENYINITQVHLNEGFSGVRVFAEISSSLKNLINLSDFLSYETKVDNCFPRNKFLAVCAYNKNCFSDEYLLKMQKIHPIEIDLINTRL